MSDALMGARRDRTMPLFFRGIPDGTSTFWIKYGPWKMVTRDKELYNLDDDEEERYNIYEQHPQVVQALHESLASWDATLPSKHVRLPEPPLPFDPMQPVGNVSVPNIQL